VSTDRRTKVSSVVGIVITVGLLVAAGAIVAVRFVNQRAEQRRDEAERAQMDELEREVRARLEAQRPVALVEPDPRLAPVPREKPAPNPAALAEQKNQAHRHCQALAQAAEAFNLSPANAHGYPRTLKELLTPPFGGPSFLRNGVRDLVDPWGKPYQLEPLVRDDGTETVLVLCFGPDNIPISQFGIGDKARPQK
jgi:cell division septation protein DedD